MHVMHIHVKNFLFFCIQEDAVLESYFDISFCCFLLPQLPILCGLPFLERRASQTAHLVAGRTGKHLFLNDHDDGKPPLLLQMVNDSDNLKFM